MCYLGREESDGVPVAAVEEEVITHTEEAKEEGGRAGSSVLTTSTPTPKHSEWVLGVHSNSNDNNNGEQVYLYGGYGVKIYIGKESIFCVAYKGV